MNKKALSMLSLCARAGKLISGEYACERAFQNGDARLVLISGDASGNTQKKFTNKAFFYNVPVIVCGTRDEISAAIGRSNRVTVVISDEGFARNIERLLEMEKKPEVGECLE